MEWEEIYQEDRYTSETVDDYVAGLKGLWDRMSTEDFNEWVQLWREDRNHELTAYDYVAGLKGLWDRMSTEDFNERVQLWRKDGSGLSLQQFI